MMGLHLENTIVQIGVIGIGGGGTNAVDRMIQQSGCMVKYITLNTDSAAMRESAAEYKFQIGWNTTKGRGAGGNPELGRLSAGESCKQIKSVIEDCDIVFIVAGMGGGTGTGAAPVVAQIAQELDILTVGVVTKPFCFEGRQRMMQAESGIENLKKAVDALLIIPNDNLKSVSEERITFNNALAIADSVLERLVGGLIDVIYKTMIVNCDFSDIKSILKNAESVYTATGHASGPDKADEVIRQITSSKLLGTTVADMTGALLCLTTSGDVGLEEVEKISSAVSSRVLETANFILGIDFDETMDDEIRAVVLATQPFEKR